MPSHSLLRDLVIVIAALCVAIWSAVVTYKTWFDERNARLVEIGVNILRVDPEKETSITPAREWALDLIDANAGVKFSPEARKELVRKPLRFGNFSFTDSAYGHDYTDYTESGKEDKSPPNRPAPSPPQ